MHTIVEETSIWNTDNIRHVCFVILKVTQDMTIQPLHILFNTYVHFDNADCLLSL